MDQKLVNRGVLILVLIAISALFFAVVRPFIQPVFIAALFAAIFTPLYRRFLKRVGSRRSLASALTILTILFFVCVPSFRYRQYGSAVDSSAARDSWANHRNTRRITLL